MNKYTFICDEGPGIIKSYGPDTKATLEFKAADLDSILDHFEMFLRGCGFTIDGNLDIVKDEEE
jgi:hypothetical protein